MPFFKKDLKELIAFKTRYSYVEGAQKAINYCEKVLADSGYKTEQLPFNIGSTRVSNLKATIAGTDEQKYGQVLIVAHLDSTSNNPKYDAPGADDNGTGSAAVLSIARMFKKAKIKPLATVHFILFLGEEQGLYGSKAYVNNLSAEEKRKIKAVLNMDMIGFDKTPPLSVLLETNSFNRPMAEIIQKLGQKYAEISLRTSYNAWGSDHAPFLQHGIPAVLTIESEFAANPNYHKTTDLFEFVNFDLCLNIIRLNAATAYYYAVEKR
jgi:Zn-dependent M28 family amino/carboxypeptidase